MNIEATKLELIKLVLDEQSQEILEQALELIRQEKEADSKSKKSQAKKPGKGV